MIKIPIKSKSKEISCHIVRVKTKVYGIFCHIVRVKTTKNRQNTHKFELSPKNTKNFLYQTPLSKAKIPQQASQYDKAENKKERSIFI